MPCMPLASFQASPASRQSRQSALIGATDPRSVHCVIPRHLAEATLPAKTRRESRMPAPPVQLD
eukprot:4331145-Pleurochrysis_carterae.AAC.2